MSNEQRLNILTNSQISVRSSDSLSRGFKPVVPIPIVVTPQSHSHSLNQMQSKSGLQMVSEQSSSQPLFMNIQQPLQQQPLHIFSSQSSPHHQFMTNFQNIPSLQTMHTVQNNQNLPRQSNVPLQLKLTKVYQQYLSLVKQNRLIRTTIQHVNRQKEQLTDYFNTIQASNHASQYSERQKQQQMKKKRHRRNANEIQRNYICPIDQCGKSYGAQASLSQHIKLKHKEYYGTKQYDNFMENLALLANGGTNEASNAGKNMPISKLQQKQ